MWSCQSARCCKTRLWARHAPVSVRAETLSQGGKRPIHAAVSESFTECALLLLGAGAAIDTIDMVRTPCGASGTSRAGPVNVPVFSNQARFLCCVSS